MKGSQNMNGWYFIAAGAVFVAIGGILGAYGWHILPKPAELKNAQNIEINVKSTDTEEDKLERARYHVETRLKKRAGHRASFDAIRSEVNETYSDEFLKKLIDLNPKIFGTCTIKKGNKPGITLVQVESEGTQPATPSDRR